MTSSIEKTPRAHHGQSKYDRVMLKISGEALMGDMSFGLHPPTVQRIAAEVKSVHDLGVEICMLPVRTRATSSARCRSN